MLGMIVTGIIISHSLFSQSTDPEQVELIPIEKISEHLKIFPNPSDGRFQMSLEYAGDEKIVVKIFDITGNLVQDITDRLIIDASTVSADVDLQHPRSGIYFLRMEIGNRAFTKKIIIR